VQPSASQVTNLGQQGYKFSARFFGDFQFQVDENDDDVNKVLCLLFAYDEVFEGMSLQFSPDS
jgi:hypothetical protein